MDSVYSGSMRYDNTTNSTVSDYIALMKPRVMSLVLFTGIAGMLIAPGKINPAIAIISMICIAIGSGASGVLNMWYDRDIDSIMERTKNRPIVLGKIPEEEALSFGIIMSFFSVFIMGICVNLISSALLLFTILFYVFVYTMWLKRSTPQNIVIGGLAGSMPPLIGWTTVTGSIDIQPIILVLLIFLWTPPHFWALALYRSDDYAKAKVPMMPLIMGDYYTKMHILIYTLLTVACSVLPFIVGISGIIYLAITLILGIWFIYYATRLLQNDHNKIAPRMFAYSIFYLFMIFATMILDHYI
jgi:protoheme IX farnesyltransferase